MWHVVSARWYRAWERYVSAQAPDQPKQPSSPPTSSTAEGEAAEKEPNKAATAGEKTETGKSEGEAKKADKQEEKKEPHPGPIFNDDVVLFATVARDSDESKAYTLYPIKQGLKEDVDYVLLPDRAWLILSKIYGGLDVKRFGYVDPANPDKMAVDVYLQRVTFIYVSTMFKTPESVTTVYISRHETAKDLADKCRRVFTTMLKKGDQLGRELLFRLWKMLDPDVNQLWKDIDRAQDNERLPLGIDGTPVEETKVIEELGIGDKTLILVEIASSKENSMFKERKVVCPRINTDDSNIKEADLKKYVTVENKAFMRIPLRSILDSSSSCGRTGLENLGNTCYMNSGLQCLSNCQELTKYFLLGLYKGEINKENPLGQKGYLADAYAKLLDDMWRGDCRVVNAHALKKRIVMKAEQFSGYSQQDSQELILYVLDGLHEDLNRIKKKPYIANKEYNGTPDNELCMQMWDDHLKRNKSVIVDLFCGQLKSRLVCPLCVKDSITFDPFIVLSVPIPQLSYMIVTFVYADLARGAVRLKVTVTEGTVLRTVEQKLRQQLQLDEKSAVCYALVRKSRVEKRLAMDTMCAEAFKGDVYAYEYVLPPPAAEKEKPAGIELVELQCQYMHKNLWGKSRQDIGYPLMLMVPRGMSVRGLKCEILRVFQPFIKESPVAKDAPDRVKAMYEHYFTGENAQSAPYVLEIVNNRSKSTQYLVRTKYAECEFCDNADHADNCLLEFKDESVMTFGDLISRMKTKRELIINMLIQDSQEIMDVERMRKHFDEVGVIKPPAEKATKISLYDCLECFSNEEQLDSHNMWYCPRCKTNVQAKKKMDIYRLPAILVIHLKRFKHKSSMLFSHKKIDDFVNYPISGLDLRRYIKSAPEIAGGCTYDLFAVSNHYGGLGGGHYTATCFNSYFAKWFYFNDSSVSAAGEEDVVSSAGYVLFYRRVESPTAPGSEEAAQLK